ncbi:MAG: response regulator [Oceanospirillales bacterium]|uniref:Twitching motility two-component system response regulator PilH n=1 Tax=Marinobacterium halophilum TaxID=267374 RepID=A0A2P8ESI0_9GAMM|nr:response regulator [Marinobacterium halophilum]MBR9828527.1 response regulator [Oceanospirillales bacterium]PSL12413.1 twitching motility two-component system response regulator PilH [Marinobacterium halophilum]
MAVNKILIVEDDPVQQQCLSEILHATGAEIIIGSNGQQGILLAESEKPDLIFMDIVMPEVDGFSACRQITNAASTKGIPVIIVSSKHEDADRVWAQLQGASAMIAKPYSSQEILDQVEAFS